MKKFKQNAKAISIALATALALGLMGPISALGAGPAALNLGAAGNFTILSKTGVSTTGSTYILGDIGVGPAAASYMTGFGLNLPAAGSFSTSAQVNGKVYAPDYAEPTPTNLTTAVADMQTAYTDAMSRVPDATEIGGGDIGGLTFAPGVYKWNSGVIIPSDITLSGNASDTWIFQIGQNLNVSSGVKVMLSGGAQAGNVFWAVGGSATIGTAATFNGNILDKTAVILNTGATLNGKALAQTAVTLDSNNIISPSLGAITPTPGPYVSPVPTPGPVPMPNPTPIMAPPFGGLPPGPSTDGLWPNGSLVKPEGGNTVYMVIDGQLKPFTSASIFLARGLKFSDVQTISPSEIPNFFMASPVTYPDGSLIKGSGPTVYIVVNGQKSGIPSLEVFQRLGLSFSNLNLLSDAEVAGYTDAAIQQ